MYFRLFVFLSILSILSMASPLSNSPRTNVAANGLDVRQLGIEIEIDIIIDSKP
jgi:hypothetical protein